MTKGQVKEGLDKAYKKAGHNAYFGSGFEAGVKFALEAQKTAHNSDYAKCEHKNVSWAEGKWFCEDCKRPVIVTAHFAYSQDVR